MNSSIYGLVNIIKAEFLHNAQPIGKLVVNVIYDGCSAEDESQTEQSYIWACDHRNGFLVFKKKGIRKGDFCLRFFY